jgi:nucleoside-diphosphate-sugar epimerase
MAFTRFVNAAVRNEEIHVYGSGEQIRDFTYVGDVVEANILAASIGTPPGSVFNVAGGAHSSVNAVLKALEELTGKRLLVVRQDPIAGDVQRTGGDTTAIRSALGWRPEVSLRAGLARQLAWATDAVPLSDGLTS